LDEPFGALDAKVRRELRRWLRHIHDETGVTTVFVTHDQEEALDLADRVAILKDGRIEQIDTPLNIYRDPASAFVHDFLGGSIHLDATVEAGFLSVDGWRTPAPADAPTGPVILAVRGEDLTLAQDYGIAARVTALSERGPRNRIELEIEGAPLEVEVSVHDPLAQVAVGASIRVKPDRLHLFRKP
jgi:sulfate transport system ATP-binding protein